MKKPDIDEKPDENFHIDIKPSNSFIAKGTIWTAKVVRHQAQLQRETAEVLLERLNSLQQRSDPGKETTDDQKSASPKTPPALAELLLTCLSSKKTGQVQLGDLEEIFVKNVEVVGYERARRHYWVQVAKAVGPNVWRIVKSVLKFGVLVDYVRAKLGL